MSGPVRWKSTHAATMGAGRTLCGIRFSTSAHLVVNRPRIVEAGVPATCGRCCRILRGMKLEPDQGPPSAPGNRAKKSWIRRRGTISQRAWREIGALLDAARRRGWRPMSAPGRPRDE